MLQTHNETAVHSAHQQNSTFYFLAKKRGKHNPFLRNRFFVCNPQTREISYWRNQHDYKRSIHHSEQGLIVDMRKCRGIIVVKDISRVWGLDLMTTTSGTHSSTNHIDNKCSIEIKDVNGRVYHLCALSKRDLLRLIPTFSKDSSQKKKSHNKAESEKNRRLMELNSIRTQLRERKLDTIGRFEELKERLAVQVAHEQATKGLQQENCATNGNRSNNFKTKGRCARRLCEVAPPRPTLVCVGNGGY
jgi:hypothetical protein